MTDKPEKIAVGMSGGMDSAMTAWMLKEAGHEVVGLTMRLVIPEGGVPCGGEKHVAEAAAICRKIGIPHEVVDANEIFEKRIVKPFVQSYRLGLTPSPCMACNPVMKFGVLLTAAFALGYDKIATGHYACIEDIDGRPRIRRGRDSSKDQSYFLARLTMLQMMRAVFPLGGFHKSEIREKAIALGLVAADKGESQDLCFIPDGDYVGFILKRHPELAQPGDFVDAAGKVLGQHNGHFGYTIGQRKGIGLSGGPWFVLRTDPLRNRVVVGHEDDLLIHEFFACEVNWQAPFTELKTPFEVGLQIRYGMKPVPAWIEFVEPERVRIRPDKPLRGVTPGQGAVFYAGDLLLGGGWIERNEA
jgi:tRNA-specific 2-thiouridylase